MTKTLTMYSYITCTSLCNRASVKTVVDRLTWSAYSTTVRMLMDRDKAIYQLLLALEVRSNVCQADFHMMVKFEQARIHIILIVYCTQVEDASGNVGIGEREFLVSPSLGSITMTAVGFTQPADSRFVTAKKPFDWMLDDQYGHLQILATHYEWFQEMFDRFVSY